MVDYSLFNGFVFVIQGNGDKKVEDERDSDTSELNSPASEGNSHHQHSFSEGSGEPERNGQSPDEAVVAENKLEPEEGIGEAGRSEEASQQDVEVNVEEDVNLEVSIERDSSSTSSSDDDESSAVDNKSAELQNTAVITPKNEEVIPIPETNAVIATSEEAVMPNEVSKNDAAPLDSDTPVTPMSQVMEHQLEATQVADSEVIDIVERGLKENEVKSLPKSYPSNEVPVALDSGKNSEVMSTTSHQSAEMGVSYVTVKSLTTSGAVETTVNQNAPGTETSIDANNAKDTKFSDSTEKQPLIASAPRVSQRTSFLNCCGLFDAFTSSDR
ncbi:hypothetical protein LINGRAHAP2_LOCUS5723 [Linum grandiflorum]